MEIKSNFIILSCWSLIAGFLCPISLICTLQDVIYRVKTAFNADFEALHKQKMKELKRVRDRNKHIREIMLQLDMHEELWEPSLTNSEWPERLLTVEVSEVTVLLKHLISSQRVQRKFRGQSICTSWTARLFVCSFTKVWNGVWFLSYKMSTLSNSR